MYFLGFYRDGSSFQYALIQKNHKTFNLLKTGTWSADVKLFDNQANHDKKNHLKTIFGIGSSDILFRELSFKMTSKSKILAALPFQVETLLPPAKSGYILAPSFHKIKEGTEVSLFAVDHSFFEKALTECEELALSPEIVSCTPQGLFRFAQHFIPDLPSLIVAYIGMNQSSFIAIDHNQLKLSLSLQEGINHLTFSGESDFSKSLERSFAFLKRKFPSVSQILFTGPIFEKENKFISMITGVSSSDYTVLEIAAQEDQKQRILRYAPAIGLCLDSMKQDENSLQLRTGTQTHPKIIRAYFQKIFSCVAASLIATGCLFGAKEQFLQKKERALKDSIVPLCQKLNVPIKSSLEDTVHYLYKQSGQSTPLDYAPHCYRLPHCLAWLSTHSFFSQPEVKIQHLNYELKQSNSKGYLVKMNIEFSAPSSLAQEIHLYLEKKDPMIFKQEPFEWKELPETYLVSFFLKLKSAP